MNPQIKQKWIAALRGGQYKQGKAHLRNGDSYCCLGVLCDIFLKEKKEYTATAGWEYIGNGFYDMRFNYGSKILPTYVQIWAELKSRNPEINGNTLSKYNDLQDYSFSQIADLIEKHL